jgi:hypothetical protein
LPSSSLRCSLTPARARAGGEAGPRRRPSSRPDGRGPSVLRLSGAAGCACREGAG